MKLNLHRELVLMQRMTVRELRRKYADLFGESFNTNNRVWLTRRIAWRFLCKNVGHSHLAIETC